MDGVVMRKLWVVLFILTAIVGSEAGGGKLENGTANSTHHEQGNTGSPFLAVAEIPSAGIGEEKEEEEAMHGVGVVAEKEVEVEKEEELVEAVVGGDGAEEEEGQGGGNGVVVVEKERVEEEEAAETVTMPTAARRGGWTRKSTCSESLHNACGRDDAKA
ncbi:glycine-rich cell wall structural protein 1 [Pyrus ussuriensis x Pyrus communis]|uniref:Glycine-rich cell wall structural protein 1 n=1 Tax=Pyrus ussuriensis x Pyrus communis TaxID=2448454 RepID=A0A5N5HXW0_9ROSA|nr:glycine-rich cell wall structural protein 1 [Pyrus ussuriensis x Pyrus communis]